MSDGKAGASVEVKDSDLVNISTMGKSDPVATSSSRSGSPGSSSPTQATQNVVLTSSDLTNLLNKQMCNDFSRVIGLKYFCGGEERYPPYPNLPCHIDPRAFFTDLESRAAIHFDDTGKIELAKQYCLGGARTGIENAIKEHANALTYENVKNTFLKLFPTDEATKSSSELLSTARRRPGETLRNFYVRLDTAYIHLSQKEPQFAPLYKKYFAARMISCFPAAFEYTLTQDEGKDPLKILNRGYEWVKAHPQTKLSDEEVVKEKHGAFTVAAVNAHDSSPIPSSVSTQRPSNTQRMTPSRAAPRASLPRYRVVDCFRCGKLGHIARHCQAGQSHGQPRMQPPSNNITCWVCGANGHKAADCFHKRPRSLNVPL